ncbi:MAG TPA: hypothetical protein VMA35_13350 [Candidatus Sulfopaludibacter sp.]|nr:hypothetical protein [Candidatus Sulfopaludibacter sp.]
MSAIISWTNLYADLSKHQETGHPNVIGLFEFIFRRSVSFFREERRNMKTIITTYPSFQNRPRGVKIKVSASNQGLLSQADPSGQPAGPKVPETAPGLHADVTIPVQTATHGS